MKTALIIGHNTRSKGAYSSILGSEFDYWKRITEKIKGEIPHLVDVYERLPDESYMKEMQKVLQELNKQDYNYCLELHFNGGSGESNGCECLIYHSNKRAESLANALLDSISNIFNVRKRGILKIRNRSERGAYGICSSKDTYILVEPFFGSNADEALKFSIESEVVALFVKYIKEGKI